MRHVLEAIHYVQANGAEYCCNRKHILKSEERIHIENAEEY